MKKVIALINLITFTLCLLIPLDVYGAEEKVVKEIKILGNMRVSKSNIINKIKTHEGDYFDQKTIATDIKRIFDTGFFSNVKIDVDDKSDGVIVSFVVDERPLLQNTNIKGNKNLKLKEIIKKISSKDGEILNEKTVKEDLNAIAELYLKKGYFGTKIDYVVEEDSATNRAILNILITEGSKVRIKKIQIKNTRAFKEKKILKLMKTRKKSLFYSGKFEKENFEEDLDRIKSFYQVNGYIDMSIVDVEKKFEAEGRQMYIAITVDEGSTYVINDISIEGNEIFPTTEIKKILSSSQGAIFLPEKIKRDLESIRLYYADKGYIDVKMSATTKIDKDSKNKLDVVFKITENEVSYINKIKIIGNRKTKDKVIRREFNVYPGELFNGAKVQRSQERLQNMGYFKTVEVNAIPTETKGKKDLEVTVEEKKTGELSFGAGFSSIDRFIGFVEVAQNNFDFKNFPYFTGGGQKLRFRSEFGKSRKDFILSFTEPWFLGKKLSFGLDLYSRDSSFLSSDFDERRKGFNIRLGKPLGEFVRGDITYTYETVDIYNVDDDSSQAIKDEAGEREVSKISLDINRDTRDNFILPSRGNRFDFIIELAGLGGDTKYYKLLTIYDQFFSLFESHIIEIYFKGGVVKEFGSSTNVPIFDRFFLGGGYPNMRGFDYRDVSPRDSQNEPIGGKTTANITVEYTFPIIDKLRGALFFDAGNVFTDFAEYEFSNINAAVGLGIKIHLPIGPIRLDYGIPIKRDDNNEDATGKFTFSLGTVF